MNKTVIKSHDLVRPNLSKEALSLYGILKWKQMLKKRFIIIHYPLFLLKTKEFILIS